MDKPRYHFRTTERLDGGARNTVLDPPPLLRKTFHLDELAAAAAAFGIPRSVLATGSPDPVPLVMPPMAEAQAALEAMTTNGHIYDLSQIGAEHGELAPAIVCAFVLAAFLGHGLQRDVAPEEIRLDGGARRMALRLHSPGPRGPLVATRPQQR
jgi:hypothetical protein